MRTRIKNYFDINYCNNEQLPASDSPFVEFFISGTENSPSLREDEFYYVGCPAECLNMWPYDGYTNENIVDSIAKSAGSVDEIDVLFINGEDVTDLLDDHEAYTLYVTASKYNHHPIYGKQEQERDLAKTLTSRKERLQYAKECNEEDQRNAKVVNVAVNSLGFYIPLPKPSTMSDYGQGLLSDNNYLAVEDDKLSNIFCAALREFSMSELLVDGAIYHCYSRRKTFVFKSVYIDADKVDSYRVQFALDCIAASEGYMMANDKCKPDDRFIAHGDKEVNKELVEWIHREIRDGAVILADTFDRLVPMIEEAMDSEDYTTMRNRHMDGWVSHFECEDVYSECDWY